MYRKSIFVLVIVLFSFVLFAQERSQPQKNQNDKGYTLSVETLEVQLPISVLDREGRPIAGARVARGSTLQGAGAAETGK